MSLVLERHGLSSRHISATWEGVVAALQRGSPVILGNDLTSVGHIIVATGYTANGHLIVNDPYGNRFVPGYGGTHGGGLFYPWECARVRNALEVIGPYPPPSRTPAPLTGTAPFTGTAPVTGTTSPTSQLPVLATPSAMISILASGAPHIVTASATFSPVSPQSVAPSIPTPTALRKYLTLLVGPGEVKQTVNAAVGKRSVSTNDNPATAWSGWGLLSMVSIAAASVGLYGVRRQRGRSVEVSSALEQPEEQAEPAPDAADGATEAGDEGSPAPA